MALVAGRDGLQRLSDGDNIHAFFRLDTQKALISSPSLLPPSVLETQLNYESGASTVRADNQEMTNKGENGHSNSVTKSVTNQELTAAIPGNNGTEIMEQQSPHGVGASNDPASELSGPTIAHGKPVRKRRKLGSKSELPGSGKQGTLPWYQPADISSKESQSVEDSSTPKAQIVEKGEESLVISVPPASEALSNQDTNLPVSKGNGGTLPKHVSPAKKVMKLRADGRLFSPPRKDVVIRPIKGGKKSSKETNKRLAVLKYGDTAQTRREIGETIERILNGTLRIKPLDKNARPDQAIIIKVDPPTKVEPHPFFLGQRKLEGQKDHPPAVPKSKNTSRASSPHRPTERSTEKPAEVLLFGSGTSKVIFPNDSQEPIWPPQDMLHIRDHSFATGTAVSIDRVWTTKAARKAKEPAVLLDETEEIWYPLKSFVGNADLAKQVQLESDMIPTPERQIIIRSELQTIVSDKLSAGQKHNSKDIDTVTKATSGSYTCKTVAAQRLFDTLPTSCSAFDTFKCENQGLTVKYAPKSSTDVLQSQESMQLLKSWLSGTSVHSTSSSSSAIPTKQKRKSLKKRRQTSEFDDFIATSEDDDPLEDPNRSNSQAPDMAGFHFDKHVPRHYSTVAPKLAAHSLLSTRAVVVSGPHGCGKTAAVYALAQELGFEVFEINAGSRRSGRDIMERVGDMTRNHLVNRLPSQTDEPSASMDEPQADTENTQQEIASGKQSTMQSFFKKQPVSKTVKAKPSVSTISAEAKSKSAATGTNKSSKNQKQSLILLEEVDVLFEEDKQFWSTIISLILTSKRPLIMTCNKESVLSPEVLAQCSLVQFSFPTKAMVAEYLLLIAAHEGHLLDLEAVSSLYVRTGLDLRASIMQLSFWCQMAVRDDMNGLNWILFPQDYQNNNLAIVERRVMSERTFLSHMGVLGNNQAWATFDTTTDAIRRMQDATLEWKMQAEDFMYQNIQQSILTKTEHSLDDLSRCSLVHDVLSAADVLQSTALLDEVKTDTHFSQHQLFNNFTASPPTLHSTPEEDMQTSSPDIIATLNYYAQLATVKLQHQELPILDYYRACDNINHRKKSLSEHQAFVRETTGDALDLLIGHDLEVSKNVATDLSPYIRSIVSYDDRLEQERDKLDKLLSDGPRAGKRQRTTRAARAALEGGHKANTRRERWFECELDFPLIFETAGKDWQEIAWTQYQRDVRKWKWAQQAEHPSSEDELCS